MDLTAAYSKIDRVVYEMQARHTNHNKSPNYTNHGAFSPHKTLQPSTNILLIFILVSRKWHYHNFLPTQRERINGRVSAIKVFTFSVLMPNHDKGSGCLTA